MNCKVLIIGAGLTGSLLASFLAKKGFNIEIYEKRENYSSGNSDLSYRTIGMSISHRGLTAINAFSISENIVSKATPTCGRVSHDYYGNDTIQCYSNDKSNIFTIDRHNLNKKLLRNLKPYKNVKIFFDHFLDQVDLEAKKCKFISGNVIKEIKYDYLFCTDGVFSACRKSYEKLLNIGSQMQLLPIGYKEFSIPFSCLNQLKLDKNLVNVWSSKNKEAIFVALPSNERKAFLINIFCPNEWVSFFKNNPYKKDIVDYLSYYFPSLKRILEQIDEKYFVGKTSEMHQVKSNYWNYKDSMLLVGDSAHAISPFYAMGMNLCFESCNLFNNLLEQKDGNLSTAISLFQSVRKKDTDAMQELAYENFINIASSSSSYYKNIWDLDRNLHEMFPEQWKPEYHWIAFTNVPFSEVKNKILKQRKIIKIITNSNGELIKEYKSNIYHISKLLLNKAN